MFPKNTFALRSGGKEPAKVQKRKKQDPFQRVREIISYLLWQDEFTSTWVLNFELSDELENKRNLADKLKFLIYKDFIDQTIFY